jgi:hypothetical protein
MASSKPSFLKSVNCSSGTNAFFLRSSMMFKRSLGLLLLVLLFGTASVSAQDGGSTLQAWGDSYTSALDISQQMEWPRNERYLPRVAFYNAADPVTPTCSSGHSHSIWQTFVPSQNGQIKIWTMGSSFDTVTAVYINTPTNANQVKCFNITTGTDVWESGTLNVKAGTRYYVMIAAVGSGIGVDGNSEFLQVYYGNFQRPFGYQIPPTGVYSNLQDHIEMADGGYVSSGGCANQNYSVYYKFRPSVSGRYEFSTTGSSYDTVIRIDDGASFSACNEDRNSEDYTSRIRVDLAGGTTYYISIGQTAIATPVQTDNMLLSFRVRKV